MGSTKLHHAEQALFHSKGLCYWACEFMLTFRGDRSAGAWVDWQKNDYAQLRKAGEEFTDYTTCYNWAKTQQAKPQVPLGQYAQVAGPLAPNSLFRVAAYVGPSPQLPSGPNHEMICITGRESEILVFDANLGFYETHADNPPDKNNREAMEHELRGLLYGDAPAGTIYDFRYRRLGSILSSQR